MHNASDEIRYLCQVCFVTFDYPHGHAFCAMVNLKAEAEGIFTMQICAYLHIVQQLPLSPSRASRGACGDIRLTHIVQMLLRPEAAQ